MRITDSNQIQTGTAQSETASVKATAQTASGYGARVADSTRSNDQVSLSNISKILNSSSTDRAALIARLTTSVRSGQYEVPSSALSRSLVSETVARAGQP